jgi:hypothetical protein
VRTLGLARTSLLRINPEHPDIPANLGCAGSTRLLSTTADTLDVLRGIDAVLQQGTE